ncbi:hypothetical protein OS493_021899 [Desmophyllum pertusum]|uniref:MACPF domain-containing protein n=1 Tax=Desmophyllum pertusum TaxID=174260 RepID=A0A9X0CYW7_9CNID|nr:hypothetical protein OS493_021899 [Desmophyllum pertusum]
MAEQQKKGQEFVNERMDIDVEPEKGWKTEDMFVPPGFHINAELTGEDEKPEGEAGEQPFVYPWGYEIYLDEVKPGDLSVNFLREFMALPLYYFAPDAPMKFQNFILRWGTHYIKSGKFGGRLQISKTMQANQVSNKQAFSQVMEYEFQKLICKLSQKGGNI